MTPTEVTWTIAICITGMFCWTFEVICRRIDHRDQLPIVRYEPRHDRTTPRGPLPDDPFSWMETQAIVNRDLERLPTSTGELRALYRRPYPGGASDTGELRALAEAGDMDGINGILDRWAAENLTGEETG